MQGVSVPCGACGKPIRGGDDFCEACGAKVDDELKDALRRRLEASDSDYAKHRKQLVNARASIIVVAALFLLSGVAFFFITRIQVDDALGKLGSASDSAPLVQVVGGATTVGELRAALEREPWQVLGLNLFLAAVMFGLWIWAKRSLLPAIMIALGIYLAVLITNALIDPLTLGQGIFMKIIVLLALGRGIQSTLAARRLEIAH